MKVLVTGASGLLGANVVEALLHEGYEVNVLLRKSSTTIGLKGLAVTFHFGDLLDVPSIIRAALGCEVIVHCAAHTLQWKTSKKAHQDINLQGTINIIEAAEKAHVKKIIYVSTANTFPTLTQNQELMRSDYIQSKKEAEDYVLAQKRIWAVVVNPSFMIGARDTKPSSGQILIHYMKQNPILTPAGGKSFIHVKDVAEGIKNSITNGQQGQRYLMANHNMTYGEFFDLANQVLDSQKKKIRIPPTLSIAAGMAGSMYERLIGESPKLTLPNAKIINSKLYYDGSDTYQLLKVTPRPITQAILDAHHWFHEKGYYL
jgi:dihydroflavonol-4-reductase